MEGLPWMPGGCAGILPIGCDRDMLVYCEVGSQSMALRGPEDA